MRIGLDIDNVIADFDKEIFKQFLIEDKNKRNSGIINPKSSSVFYGMFDWSRDEVQEFCKNKMERIAQNFVPRRNCKKIIDKLINDGHEIFLISHRVPPHYSNSSQVTSNWLKKYKINYNKLILSVTPDKTPECLEYKIDIMVDDRIKQCEIMNQNGVNCIIMKTRYNFREKSKLPIATSWNNLYNIISNYKKI